MKSIVNFVLHAGRQREDLFLVAFLSRFLRITIFCGTSKAGPEILFAIGS